MEKHIKLTGILNIVYKSMELLGSFFLLAIAAWFIPFYNWIIQLEGNHSEEIPTEILSIVPIIFGALGSLLLIFSVAGIFASIFVLKKKEWARILLLIVSFLNLLSFPLGTLLGGYSIWVLMDNETIKLFSPPVEIKSN